MLLESHDAYSLGTIECGSILRIVGTTRFIIAGRIFKDCTFTETRYVIARKRSRRLRIYTFY